MEARVHPGRAAPPVPPGAGRRGPAGARREGDAYRIAVRDAICVRFHEVDAYQIVHNVHYFNYFDVGRFHLVNEFLRREAPPDGGPYLFLVLRAECKFVSPARMAEALVVETELDFSPAQRSARLHLRHSAFSRKGQRLVAEGSSTLGVCDRDYRLLYALPDTVRAYCTEQITSYLRAPQPDVRLTRLRPEGPAPTAARHAGGHRP